MSRVSVRPYLISKDPEGSFRVVVRTTRFNSQGYPLVSSADLPEVFPTMTSARTYLRENFRAETTDIATK